MHHATIEWNEMEHCYILNDLNSAHGTYVNDCCIHNAAVRLTPGDEIHFGYGGSAFKLLVDTTNPVRHVFNTFSKYFLITPVNCKC